MFCVYNICNISVFWCGGAAKGVKAMLPVAIQLFGVRDAMEKDPKGTLGRIAEMGYQGVELCGFSGLEPAEFKEVCDSLGLRIMSAHSGPDFVVNETDRLIDEMTAVGSKYFAIAYLPDDKRPGGANYESFTEKLRAAARKMRDAGIQLLYHNHETEFIPYKGRYMLYSILESLEDGLILPELDTCWINIGGENPEEFLKKFDRRCPVVHLKDFWFKKRFAPDKNGVRPDFETRPIGYGRQDMPGILAASEEIGAEWVVVEQDNPSLGVGELECARLSRDWLKALGW